MCEKQSEKEVKEEGDCCGSRMEVISERFEGGKRALSCDCR